MSFRGPGNIMRTQPTNRYASEPAQPVLAKFGVDGKLLSEFLPDGVDGADSTSLFAITSAQDATGTIDDVAVLTVDGGTKGVGIGVAPASGNRLQVGTTATSTALTVEDSTGIVRVPHDTAGALRIGAGDDLQIWHNGTNSAISNATGTLTVGTQSGSDLIFNVNNGTCGRFDQSVNNAFVVGGSDAIAGSKFNVKTTGQGNALYVADSTGFTHIPFNAAGALRMGSAAQFQLGFDGTNSSIYSSSGILVMGTTSTSSVFLRVNSATVLAVTNRGTAQLTPLASDPGSPADGDIWVTTAGDLKFRANGTTYTVTAT